MRLMHIAGDCHNLRHPPGVLMADDYCEDKAMNESESETEVTRYQIESFVPSWLKADPSYLKALQQALVNRMLIQGWDVVEGPFIEDRSGEGMAVVPFGMVLLVAWCGVVEFDVIVPTDDEAVDLDPSVRIAATSPESYTEMG